MLALAAVDARLRTVAAATATQTALEGELASFSAAWATVPDASLMQPILAVRNLPPPLRASSTFGWETIMA